VVRDADAYPANDVEVPRFVADIGLDGIVDLHVHAMPDRLQQAVWRFFDGLGDPPWPIHYRDDAQARLDTLRDVGVVAHTALAYAHRPGMLDWLNGYTLDLAETHPQVVPTFTIFPQDDVAEQTAAAIARGGAVVKVHTQVGRFHTTDPRLDDAWSQIASARLPVMLHATAVYGVDGGDEYCGVDAIRALLDRHPDLTLVVAHVGMPEYADAIALAEAAEDVHLDLSMTLHRTFEALGAQDAWEDLGEDGLARLAALSRRVTFGSDFPSIPHDYATQVRALARLRLDDGRLRDVLSDNARRLLARTGWQTGRTPAPDPPRPRGQP
jgi:uncharacterized protein